MIIHYNCTIGSSLVPRPITDAEKRPGINCTRMREIIGVFYGYFTVYYCDKFAMNVPRVIVRGPKLGKRECAVHIAEKLSGEYT